MSDLQTFVDSTKKVAAPPQEPSGGLQDFVQSTVKQPESRPVEPEVPKPGGEIIRQAPSSYERLLAERPDDPRIKAIAELQAQKKALEVQQQALVKQGTVWPETGLPSEYYQAEASIRDIVQSINSEYALKDETAKAAQEEAPGFLEGWLRGIAALQKMPQTIAGKESLFEKAHTAAGAVLLGASVTPVGKGLGLISEVEGQVLRAVGVPVERTSVYDKDLPLGAGELFVGNALLDQAGWKDDGSALRAALTIAIDMGMAASVAPVAGKAANKAASKVRAADGARATGANAIKRLGELGQASAQGELAVLLEKVNKGQASWSEFRDGALSALKGVGPREAKFWERAFKQPLYEGLEPAHFTTPFYGTIRQGQAAYGIKYNAITDNPLFRLVAWGTEKAGIYGPSDYIAAHKDTILLPLFGERGMQRVAEIAQGVRLMSKPGQTVAASHLDVLRNPEAASAFREVLDTPAKQRTPTAMAFEKAMSDISPDQFGGIMGDFDSLAYSRWKGLPPAEKFDQIMESLNRPSATGGPSRMQVEAAYLELVGEPGKALGSTLKQLHLAEDKVRALEKVGVSMEEVAVARAEVTRLGRRVGEITNVLGLEDLFQAHPWLRRDMGNPPLQAKTTTRPPMRGEPHEGLGAVRTPTGEPRLVTTETIIPPRARVSEEFSTIWSPARVEDFITSRMVRASGKADVASSWANGMARLQAATLNHVPVLMRDPRKGLIEIMSAAFARTAGLPPRFIALRTALEAQGAAATLKTIDTLKEMSQIYGKLPADAQKMVAAAQQLDLPYLQLTGPGAAPTPDRARVLANTAKRAMQLLSESDIEVSEGTMKTLERAARLSVGPDATDVAFGSAMSKGVDNIMYRNFLGDREPSAALRQAFEVEKGKNLDRTGAVHSSRVPSEVQFKGELAPGKKTIRPWHEGDLVDVDFTGWAGELQSATKEYMRDLLDEMGRSVAAITEARDALIAHGGPEANRLVARMDNLRNDLMRKERLLGYSAYPGDFFPEEIDAAGIKHMQLKFGKDSDYASLVATEGGQPLTTKEINRRIKEGRAPYGLIAQLQDDKDWLASIRGSKLAPYFSEDPMLRIGARALMLGKSSTYDGITKEALKMFGKEVPVEGMTRKDFANSLALALAETRDPVIMVGGASGRYRILDSLDMAMSVHQKDPKARVFAVDRRMAFAIEDLRLSWADKMGEAWKGFTKLPGPNVAFGFQNMFKRWGLVSLGYHVRNFEQGLLVNYLMGTTPSTIGACLRGLADPDHLIYTATGPITFRDALQLFRDQGVSRSMLGAATPTAATEVELSELQKTIAPSKWQRIRDLVPGANRSVAEAQEFMVRFPAFIQMLRTGEAPAYAANKVRYYLFDNSNITNFEKNFMGSWVPWYNWFRNTLAFGAREMFENPGTMFKYMTGVEAGRQGAKALIMQTVKPWHQEGGEYVSAPKWADQNVPYQLFKYLRNGDLGRQRLIWLGFDGEEGSKSFGDLYFVNTEGQEYMHDFVRTYKAAVSALTPWGEKQEHGMTFFAERLGPHLQIPLATAFGVNPRRASARLPDPEQRGLYMNLALPQKPTVDPIQFGKRLESGHQAQIAREAGHPLSALGFTVRDNVQTAIDWANSLGGFGMVLNAPVIRTLPFTRMVNELTDEGRTWTATAWREAGLTVSSINILDEMRRYKLQMMADINELKGTPKREMLFRHNKKLQSVIERVSDADLAAHPAIRALREKLESEFKDYLKLEAEFLGTKKIQFVPRTTKRQP